MTDGAIVIGDGRLAATVLPRQGGALGRLDLDLGEGRIEPIFLAGDQPGRAGPFTLAMNVLVPWSNRIAGGGFPTATGRVELPPNLPGEPCPIHGNGFQAEWAVTAVDPVGVVLGLVSDGPGAFAYEATLAYRITGGALAVSLTVVNHAGRALPYGLGLHPWLPRTPRTRLHAPATGVWLEDERHLPTRHEAFGADDHPFAFDRDRRLPPGWINNALTGWSGRATVTWPERGLVLDLEADAGLGTLVVYSPSSAASYVCIEPVSHPVDAHNRREDPAAAGLVDLAPGAALAVGCRFVPRSADLPDRNRGPQTARFRVFGPRPFGPSCSPL